MNKEILKYQKDCFAHYLKTMREQIPEFPKKYIYPDGNPVRPVLPVQITPNKIMLIGAFPSARFERRDGVLIPIADNLSPFGEEKYFDGREIRIQESRESLNRYYFPQLDIKNEDLWITDIVKVYLFPEKHIKNCEIIAPKIKFYNTHKMFKKIAKASLNWIIKEIEICNPKLIITLGEIPARVISSDYKSENVKLLDGSIREVKFNKVYKISHLAHPEIRRRNKEWDDRTKIFIHKLSKVVKVLNYN